ncbi:MAG: hypothetical protein JWP74_3077 [Marmoricola sp.]|nr:hypothetical protein [Marmoricola sp.]
MKRISFWALSTVSAVVLLFSYHTSTAGSSGASTSVHSQQPVVSSTEPTSTATSSATSSAGTSTKKSSSASTARTVTGSVASTQWGPVQVELTVAADKITKVTVLQYPSGNGRDGQINAYALPILTKETIASQSASIDMVSGATVTSGGYLQSLQSALDQANL